MLGVDGRPEARMSSSILSDLIFGLIVVYLSSVLLFALYLRRAHRAVWENLGSFSLSNWGISNSLRVANYVLFQRAYKELNDRRAARYVLAIRMLTFAVLTPLVVFSWIWTHVA